MASERRPTPRIETAPAAGALRALLIALCCLGVVLAAPAALAQLPGGTADPIDPADKAGVSWLVESAPPAAGVMPPLPASPLQLIVDDGGRESDVGLAGPPPRNFLWFNSFEVPPAGFSLEEIWVLFGPGAGLTVGDPVQLVVYHDPDSDPSTGADLLASYDETILALDGSTFSDYPLAAPLTVPPGGDVLIGAVYRGTADPAVTPASLDTTASQGRSWVAVWSGAPPNPPMIAPPGDPDDLLSLIDDLGSIPDGNWMIRGFGSGPTTVAIPTLGGWGLLLLAALLTAAGFIALRRSGTGGAGPVAGAGLLLLIAALAADPAAAQTTVDDFSTAQAALNLAVPPDAVGDNASSNQGGAGMIGGERDLELLYAAGGGGGEATSAEVTAGALELSADAGATALLTVTWDGDTDPLTLDPVGLGGADLTAGGATALRFNAAVTGAPIDLEVEVFTDGANSSKAALLLPAGAASDFFIAFNEFLVAQGTGADFTNVGAVVVRLRASGNSLTLDIVDAVLPSMAATKVDTLVNDVDMDTQADPGDTIRYTVTITNTGGEATTVDLSDMVDGNTTLDGASVRSTPIAKNDQYTGFGNVSLAVDGTPGKPGLTANDDDPDGDSFTVTAFDAVTARGGSVSNMDFNAGTFDYDPPAGVRGVDSFTYTITDDNGDSDVGVAFINLDQTVWFVDNTNSGCGAPPCGDGTQADAFQTFKQAETASAANDIIRIREGDGTDTGHSLGFILKPGQRLVGGAADLLLGGDLIEAGAGYSVHSHGAGAVLLLAGDHVIEGMILNPTTAHGAVGAGTSNIVMDDVMINTSGSGGGISLTNHNGSFTFSNSAIAPAAATTGVAVAINGGSGVFNFAGSPVAHEGGGLLHVTNTTGGAMVDFTGASLNLNNGTADGILLDNNAGGATIVLPAIGFVRTGSGNSIRIAGSGTVHLDGIGPLEAVGGAGLDVSGTTIVKAGAPGPVTVTSVDSSGGPIGINLNGVAPAVTVSGTTTINNTGGIGIILNSSGAASFVGQLAVTASGGAGLVAFNTGPVTATTGTNTVSATGGPAVDVTGGAMSLTFATLSSTGTASNGVNLANTTGSLNGAAGAIAGGAGGSAFRVNGGAPTVTYGGTVTQNAANRVVEIANTTGGSATFNAKVTGGASSTGVLIDNADGDATFADVDLGTNASRLTSTGVTLSGGSVGLFSFADTQVFTNGAVGFSANNGGVVEAIGTGNRVTTTSAISVDLIGGTTIGMNHFTVERVDANGGMHGIRLENTGAAGSFRVTGDGTTTIGAATGGLIQNATSSGIRLVGTMTPSFNNLTIDNSGFHGVHGPSGVNGFEMRNCLIEDAGNADNEHGMHFVNMVGTATLDNTTLTRAANDLILLHSTNANSTWNVTNSNFLETDGAGGLFGNDGLSWQVQGNSVVTLTANNNEFGDHLGGNGSLFGNAIDIGNATGGAVMATGTFHFNADNNVIDQDPADLNKGGSFKVSGQDSMTVNITWTRNTFTGAKGNGLLAIDGNDSSAVNATIGGAMMGNSVSNATNSNGIVILADEAAVVRAVVQENNLTMVGTDGIQIANFGSSLGQPTEMDVSLIENVINGHNGGAAPFIAGIDIFGGGAAGGSTCIRFSDNSVSGTPAGFFDYSLDDFGAPTGILVEGPGAAAVTVADIRTLNSQPAATVSLFGSITFSNGVPCDTP